MAGFYEIERPNDVEIINGHALVASWWEPLQVAPLQCDYSSASRSETIDVGSTVLTLGVNPAPGHVSLALAMPRCGVVRLAMHDVQGRRIRELFHGSLSNGTHTFLWDGRDDAGAEVKAERRVGRRKTAGHPATSRTGTKASPWSTSARGEPINADGRRHDEEMVCVLIMPAQGMLSLEPPRSLPTCAP